MRNLQQTGLVNGRPTTLKQISKSAAKVCYLSGIPVWFQSSQMRPFNNWQDAFLYEKYTESFEQICKNFMFWNCDANRGTYINFYKKI